MPVTPEHCYTMLYSVRVLPHGHDAGAGGSCAAIVSLLPVAADEALACLACLVLSVYQTALDSTNKVRV